eukprot:COSAG06_NODE_288_length_18224_cov_8.849948_5_plen_76_part_00
MLRKRGLLCRIERHINKLRQQVFYTTSEDMAGDDLRGTCSGEYICHAKMGGRPDLSAHLNVETAGFGSERKRPEI